MSHKGLSSVIQVPGVIDVSSSRQTTSSQRSYKYHPTVELPLLIGRRQGITAADNLDSLS